MLHNPRIAPTPLGFVDEETFYAERDSRTTLGVQIGTQPRRVAVVLPVEAVGHGAALALLLAASAIRRMGRGFADTTIITPDGLRAQPARFALNGGEHIPLLDQLVRELGGADPFGRFEWRTLASAAFDDVDLALWLGGYINIATRTPPAGHIVVNARGWVTRIERPHSPAFSAVSAVESFDAAPAAIASSVALAAAEILKISHGPAYIEGEDAPTLWSALDTGEVTTDSAEGGEWFTHGAAADGFAAWSPEQGDPPSLSAFALVAAGGLGMNVAHLLAESYLNWTRAVVIDPDQVEPSNLNRLFGVGIGHLGAAKADLASRMLQSNGRSAESVVATYEAWSKSGGIAPFLGRSDALVIGVDQVVTRLEAAADWPTLLVNGATAGTSWTVTAHRPGIGGCLGCYYGLARTSYSQARNAVHCAGAGAIIEGEAVVVPHQASYPHVSLAAAAMMVAVLIHACSRAAIGDVDSLSGSLRRSNLLTPELSETRNLRPVESCRLLCSDSHVQRFLSERRRSVKEAFPTQSTEPCV